MEKWNLPVNWTWNKLSAFLEELESGGRPKGGVKGISEGIPSIGGEHLASNGGFDFSSLRYVPESFAKTMNRGWIKQGDILIVKDGATTGKTSFVENTFPFPKATINEHVFRLRANSERILQKYLFFFLFSALGQNMILSAFRGSAQGGINQGFISAVDLPLPYVDKPAHSLETQRRIVQRLEALLAEVSEARKFQETIKEETGLLVDAALREIFSKSQEWENISNLENLVEIQAPLVDPKLPEYTNLPHIYGKSIKEGTGRLLEYHTAAEDGMTSSKYLFEPGVVLYSKIRPYLRKVTIADFRGLCSADMYPLTIISPQVDREFLLWTLLSPPFTEYINGLSGRARIPKVNREQLFAYQMRYPDFQAQKWIVNNLNTWRDEVIEMESTQKENAKLITQLEQSFLAQAFRGEL